MNPEDPIEKLQRHYARLQEQPAPMLVMPREIRWWEVAGGLVAGAAVVLIAVGLSLSNVTVTPNQGGILLEYQLRSAGLTIDRPLPDKRAQGEGTWSI